MDLIHAAAVALAALPIALERPVSYPMRRLEGSPVRYVQMPRNGRLQNLVVDCGHPDEFDRGVGYSPRFDRPPVRPAWADTKTRVDGVLEADYLLKWSARIDFSADTLTFSRVRHPHQPTSPVAVTAAHRSLIARGYTAVSVGGAGTRHPLAVAAAFAGSDLEVVLDTGGPSRVFLGESWGGGFGVSLATVRLAESVVLPYSIGPVASQAPVAVRPTDWPGRDTLGVDLLDRHAAVLDFASRTLYLKPAGEPATLYGFRLPIGGGKSPRQLQEDKWEREARQARDLACPIVSVSSIPPANPPPTFPVVITCVPGLPRAPALTTPPHIRRLPRHADCRDLGVSR